MILVNKDFCVRLGNFNVDKTTYCRALKYVQTLKPVLTDASLRTKLKMYRDAYNFGADIASSNASVSGEPHAICTDTLYPCQKPQVIVKQARTVYKLV